MYYFCLRCDERWRELRDFCPKCGAGTPFIEASMDSGFERPPEEQISARAMYWILVNWWRRLRRRLGI
jgi:hypothetical protein